MVDPDDSSAGSSADFSPELPPPLGSAQEATSNLNRVLIDVLEQLAKALTASSLPESLRSATGQVMLEIARIQGVTEWVSEDLARLTNKAPEEEE